MKQQYFKAKARFPKHLLFFRAGDVFELYHDDARTAARLLGLQLGRRDGAALAAVSVFTADIYLSRLLRQGYSVAVCDPMESKAKRPAPARKQRRRRPVLAC